MMDLRPLAPVPLSLAITAMACSAFCVMLNRAWLISNCFAYCRDNAFFGVTNTSHSWSVLSSCMTDRQQTVSHACVAVPQSLCAVARQCIMIT